MTRRCCMGEAGTGRVARRLSGLVPSAAPGALLLLLPKCPLCLAAWLTAATGIGFSAAGAAWVRGILVIFAVAAVALTAGLFRRRSAGQGCRYSRRQTLREI